MRPFRRARIVERVAGATGITVDDMRSPEVSAEAVNARHLAMWMVRLLTNQSTRQIGDYLQRDHTTVRDALAKINTRRVDSQAYRDYTDALLDSCKQAIKGG